MLEILHNQINNVVSICGVADNRDGTYRVDYLSEPTSEQQIKINAIIQNWPLEKLKLEKLSDVDNQWKLTVENGWTTPYGWKLGIDTQDVTLLTGAFILAKEASSIGISTPVSIIDTDGVPHNLELSELTALMLQYGQFRSNISSEYANKKNSIKNATTLEELNNI